MEKIKIQIGERVFFAQRGQTLLSALIEAGLRPDAPCGGNGLCGKCIVSVDGALQLACQYVLTHDIAVNFRSVDDPFIASIHNCNDLVIDDENRFTLAVDLGTTTIVACLSDGRQLLAQKSCLNPQAAYGADVISRLQHAADGKLSQLSSCVRSAILDLAEQTASAAKIPVQSITCIAVAGNTAMHHLFLGIDISPLITPPYMPAIHKAMELPAETLFPLRGSVRLLPNIAGFVGGDTVACMIATQFDSLHTPTLLLDIGTNGELVLTDGRRRIACSTAAGPAFEGAKISCGMRGVPGAVDHVRLEDGVLHYHVIGEGEALGICGSGLLDWVAALLDMGWLEPSGRMEDICLPNTKITLTQRDIREVQLAKAAIRAGIELLAKEMALSIENIQAVLLAGAFGNYLNPAAAVRIGMIPPALSAKVRGIGNAAEIGVRHCAVNRKEFERSQVIADETEFLELASQKEFQDYFIDALEFPEASE